MSASSSSIEVVLLDIEGTVCPITFVKDSLFPYFIEKVPDYLSKLEYPLTSNSHDDVTKILSEFSSEYTNSYDSLLSHIQHLVKTDQKVAPLKSLQGIVWKNGYEKGELLAPLYKDSINFLVSPPLSVKKVCIYSSGSIKAQKLLFGHVKGLQNEPIDLNDKLDGYFDITTSGYKQESTSYLNILKDLNYEDSASKVLFLSDNVNEVKAALDAGMKSIVVVKPGNAPLSDDDKASLNVIHSFDELDL